MKTVKLVLVVSISLFGFGNIYADVLLCDGVMKCQLNDNDKCKAIEINVSFSIDLSSPDIERSPNSYRVLLSSNAVEGKGGMFGAEKGSKEDDYIAISRSTGVFSIYQIMKNFALHTSGHCEKSKPKL